MEKTKSSADGLCSSDPFSICRLTHPEVRRHKCFLPAKPFNGVICPQCKRVQVTWGPLKHLAWWLWWGWRYKQTAFMLFEHAD